MRARAPASSMTFNGLIRQETASNISIGKPNGGLQRLVGKLGFVMGLVLRAQASQNLDSSSSVGASTFTVMAKAESDYTADNFLQWLIKEQLEEVASMGQLLRVVQRAGEGNLLRVEEYLAREKGKGVALSEEE